MMNQVKKVVSSNSNFTDIGSLATVGFLSYGSLPCCATTTTLSSCVIRSISILAF